MTPIRLLPLAFIVVAAAACSPPSDGTEQAGETDSPATVESAMRHSAPDSLSLDDSVAAARSDLAGRLDIEPESIEVEQARRVTWADGALGCPEPGMMYTMALVEGYYIRLAVGGKAFAYHAGRDGRPFHCPAERSRTPPDRRELR